MSSNHAAAPLVDHLLRKCTTCSLDVYQQMYQCKLDLWVSCRSDLSAQADLLCDQFSPHLCRAFEAASEQGAFTMLPIAEHGFALSKGGICDALCLRFGWHPVNLFSWSMPVLVPVMGFHLSASMKSGI